MSQSSTCVCVLAQRHRLRLWKFFPRGGAFALLLWIVWCLPGLALEIRVAIQENASQVTVGTSNTGIIREPGGNAIAQLPGGRSLTVASQNSQLKTDGGFGDTFWVEPTEGGYVFIGDRWYRGRVLVSSTGSGVTAINYVDLDYYLYSVVGGEMSSSWPVEALKAQAVAARSYALHHRQKGRHPNYDVNSTTASQVYDGLEDESQSTQIAVESTRNQVLTYDGEIIEAVFHSSSGGHTENVEDVWSKPLPYLRGVQDFDAGAPVYQWVETFSLEEVNRQIAGVGYLYSAIPQQVTPLGRVQEILLEGDSGSRILTGNDIRQALDLRSTLFSINISGDVVQVAGRGYGHGIGMSQWGAHNMAQQGYSYQQILGHYYQGAQLAIIEEY